MAFLENPRFPDDIAYGSRGGPAYRTSVLVQASGFEKRNIAWSQARHQYDVSYGVRTQEQLDSLLTYFHSAQGRAHSFRFKDFSDFHTGTPAGHGDSGDPVTAPTKDDVSIGTGDAAEVDFQLIKSYVTGTLTTTRDIVKPINGTVLIALDGALQTETTNYTIDYATGIVTFVVAPGGGVDITWGGQFDVPVRFDSDEMSTVLDFYLHGSMQLQLVEDRL